MKNNPKKQLTLFIVICFTITFIIDLIIYEKGGLENLNLTPLQMLVPALAAIAILVITKDKPIFKNLGFRSFKIKYWLMGTAIILIYILKCPREVKY